jgi:uncharacterized glyoxalase superfamily protein PhnB
MAEIQPIIHVTEIEPALAFYKDGLGFEEVFTMPGEDGKLVHAGLKFEDATVMIAKSAEGRAEGGEGVVLYVYMDGDLDGYFQDTVAKAEGVRILHEPQDQFWQDRTFGIKDPWGYEVHFAKALGQPQA